jgi:hypothetical protein
MDNENILTWSATNMVTIWLMALIGCLIFLLIAKFVNNAKGGAMNP